MNKHTPGPWNVSKDGVTVYNNASDDPCRNFVICSPTKHSYFSKDQLIANAKLIAAAPDLLEALQMVLDADLNNRGMEHSIFTSEQCAQIAQAIKKATL